MPNEERIFAGQLDVGGTAMYAELWVRGNKVVVFGQPGNRVWGVLTEATFDHDDKGRLQVSGIHDGEPIVVTAQAEPRILATWNNANVQFANGTKLDKATVHMTTYGVKVLHKGKATNLAAHRTNSFQRVGYVHGPEGLVATVELAASRSCCGRS